MADVKLNSLATKTNANAAAILVKDSATQNAGAEGWITKAQLNQIIRDEVKAQLSAITSGTPDVPVLDGSTLKYMTLANFAKVVGGLKYNGVVESGTLADLGPGLALCARSLYVPSDMYSTEFNNCCVVTLYFVDNVRLQICFSNNKFCYRRAWYSNTYADWQLVS